MVAESETAELAKVISINSEVDPRTVPVRFSNLKHMACSPFHYWDAVQVGRDDTLAMRLGRGAHAMVLDQPVVLYRGKQRRGKEFEAFKADQDPTAEILIASEWGKATGIANAIRRNADACRVLFDATVLEQTIEWDFGGRKCSSRPDSMAISGRAVTDLKTTQCAEPEKFARDAMYRGYNGQMAFYDKAVEHKCGRAPDDLYVVAVESKRPYAVTVLRMTDEAREAGHRLWRSWFEQLRVCEESNTWPSYTDSIVEFDVGEAGGELKLMIGGEEYDFDEE